MQDEALSSARFTAVLTVTAVSFFLLLLPFELIPEIPVDIDAKPFFAPLAICALLPSGRIGLAVALGVALGEGLRDLMEGYELDDPIGFFGYIAGFLVASAIFNAAPFKRWALIFGSIACAGVQALLEASSFLLFGQEGLTVALYSAAGNTISHGVIFGAIPLLFFLPALHGRFEHYLGFAPRGAPEPEALSVGPFELDEVGDVIAALDGASFRAAAAQDPAFQHLSITVEPGEVLALTGPDLAACRAVAQALAGLAPSATGGVLAGRAEPAEAAALVAPPPADYITQMRPIQEVAAGLMARGLDAEEAFAQGLILLRQVGIGADHAADYGWTLSPGDQMRMLIAAARAYRAPLLIIDQAFDEADPALNALLLDLIDDQREWGAVVWIDGDLDRVRQSADPAAVLNDGRLMKLGDPVDVSELDLAGMSAGQEPDPVAEAVSSPLKVRVPTLQGREEGWWVRRDARVKWLLFIGLIAMIYIAPDWRWMAGLTAVGMIMVLTARPSPFWLTLALLVQAPNIIGLILIPWWTGEAGSLEDLEFGLRLGLGWLAAILFGLSVLSSMDPPAMVSGLRGLGLPQRFAFTIGYAFLLVYLSIADFQRLASAVRRNYGAFRVWRPDRYVAFAAALILPAIIAVARRGGAMALALEARDGDGAVTPVLRKAPDQADWALLIVGLGVLAAAIAARFGWLG